MAATLLPAMTGPYAVGNRRLFLTDTSRPDPFSGAASRQVSVIAWYPTSTAGPVAKYLSNVDSYDASMALALTNGLESRGCSSFFGSVWCFPTSVNNTMYPNIRSRDTRAVLNGAVRTDLGLLPTVVFSPGYGVPGNCSSILAQELASHGYLVLTMSSTWESIATELSSSVATQNGPAVTNAWQKILTARIGDCTYALNQLASLPNGIGAQADLDRIAMVGHSYGGYTGMEMAYQDARVKAVAVLDGTAGWDGTSNNAMTHGVSQPVMLLSGQVIAGDNYTVGAEHPSWATYAATNHGPLHMYQVAGAAHYAFTDVGKLTTQPVYLLGSINADRAMALHPRWTRAFLDTYIKGSPDSLLTLNSLAAADWPEVSAA